MAGLFSQTVNDNPTFIASSEENAKKAAESAALAEGFASSAEQNSDEVTIAANNTAMSEQAAKQYAETASGFATQSAQAYTDIQTLQGDVSDYLNQVNVLASSTEDVIEQTFTYRNEAEVFKNTAQTSSETAVISANNAKTSETNAANSASSATQSSNNANVSASNAANSASKASTSETNAANSASQASTSETNAKVSETNAKASEDNAAISVSQIDGVVTTVTNLRNDTKTDRDSTEEFKTQASTSASNAKTSETNAKVSETNAANSAASANVSATNAEEARIEINNRVDESISSSEAAIQSATNAANSASQASLSETNSAQSASEAANALSQLNDQVEITSQYTQESMQYRDETLQYRNEAQNAAEATNLTNYYTKDVVDQKFNDIPEVDLTGYYTKSDVDNAISEIDNNVSETFDSFNTYVEDNLDLIRRDDVPFDVNNIYPFGSTLMYQSFRENGNANSKFQYLYQQISGKNVYSNVYWARANYTVAQTAAIATTVLDDATKNNRMMSLLIVQTGMQDIINANATTYDATLAQSMYNDLDSMCNTIVSSGHRVMLGTLTYSETYPVEEYNKNVFYPLIKKYSPEFWKDGRPLFDLYQLSVDNLRAFNEAAERNPDNVGQSLVRAYTARKIWQASTRTFTIIEKPSLYNKRVLVNFNNNYAYNSTTGANEAVLGAESLNSNAGATGAYNLAAVRDVNGNMLYGISMQLGPISGCSYSGRGVGDSTKSITNSALTTSSAFVDGTEPSKVIFDNLPNGLIGTLSITGSVNATDNRIGTYTVDGVTKTLNASSAVPEVITFDFEVRNNRIIVDWDVADGSQYAYISAIQLDFRNELDVYDDALSDIVTIQSSLDSKADVSALDSKADVSALDNYDTSVAVDSKISTVSSSLQSSLDSKRDISDTRFDTYTVRSTTTTSSLAINDYNMFRIDVSSNRSISFSGTIDSYSTSAKTILVHLYNSSLSSRTVTWPSEIKWNENTAPAMEGTGMLITLLWTGSVWIGNVGAKY